MRMLYIHARILYMFTHYIHYTYICIHTIYAHTLYICTHTIYMHTYYIYAHILYICTHTVYAHTIYMRTHTEWSYWSTTSRVPGVVPKRAVDISSLPSWHLEQRGGLEGPAIQTTVWGKGHQTRLTGTDNHQTRLTGTDNKLYHILIIIAIYTLTFSVSILHSSQLVPRHRFELKSLFSSQYLVVE